MGERPHQLGYAPGEKWHRRRWVRRAIAGALLVIFAVAVVLVVRPHYSRLRGMWEQRRQLRWTMPADEVFAEMLPEETEKLANARQFPNFTMMVHGRRVPGKPERLVLVWNGFYDRWRRQKWPEQFPEDRGAINATVLRVMTLREDSDVVGYGGLESPEFAEVPLGGLRFYAGQPDPADESHFTIEYETPEGRGVIDGWLMPDDSVKFEVRTGPAAAGAIADERGGPGAALR